MHWNAAASLWYQTLLTLHQLILFYYIPIATYGLIGTLFSFLYLAVFLLNFGLDKSLPSLLITYSESKTAWRKFLIRQVVAQTGLLIIIAGILLLFHQVIGSQLTNSLHCCAFTWTHWLLWTSAFIIESTRKTLKTIAQLAFLNKQTAILEFFSVVFYIGMVWLGIYYYQDIVSIPFGALCLEALFNVLVLTLLIIGIYRRLPNKADKPSHIPTWRHIIKNRATIYANHVCRLLLSSNFMVSIFAFSFGLVWVSTIKVANSIAAFLLSFFERTFGITSASLLSRVKYATHAQKQENFSLALRSFYTIFFLLTASSLLLFLMIFGIHYYLYAQYPSPLLTGYLFMLVTFVDVLFIPQEQLLLVEDKISYLFILNCCTALLMYGLSLSALMTPMVVLALFITIRLAAFYLLNRLIKTKLGIHI